MSDATLSTGDMPTRVEGPRSCDGPKAGKGNGKGKNHDCGCAECAMRKRIKARKRIDAVKSRMGMSTTSNVKSDPMSDASSVKARAARVRAAKTNQGKGGASSSKVERDPITGKMKSARAKVGGECSSAMSSWKLHGMTPATAATLAKCRAMARQRSLAHGTRIAGNEARAQHWEHRVKLAAEGKTPITAKERLAKAKALRAQRAAKRIAGDQATAQAQVTASTPMALAAPPTRLALPAPKPSIREQVAAHRAKTRQPATIELEHIGGARTGTNAWAAEITGPSQRYGLERKFMRGVRSYSGSNSVGTRGVSDVHTLEPGKVYEVSSPRSWKKTDRYFATAHAGEVREIPADRVARRVRLMNYIKKRRAERTLASPTVSPSLTSAQPVAAPLPSPKVAPGRGTEERKVEAAARRAKKEATDPVYAKRAIAYRRMEAQHAKEQTRRTTETAIVAENLKIGETSRARSAIESQLRGIRRVMHARGVHNYSQIPAYRQAKERARLLREKDRAPQAEKPKEAIAPQVQPSSQVAAQVNPVALQRNELAAKLRADRDSNKTMIARSFKNQLIRNFAGIKRTDRDFTGVQLHQGRSRDLQLTTEQRQRAAAGLRSYHNESLGTPAKQAKTAEQAARATERYFAKRTLFGPEAFKQTSPPPAASPATPTPTPAPPIKPADRGTPETRAERLREKIAGRLAERRKTVLE